MKQRQEHRTGLAAGMLAGLLIFGLAVPAFGAVGQKMIQAHYRNIIIRADEKIIHPLDAAGNAAEPFIVDGTTYLPVRAISEALGREVVWDEKNNTVFITSPEAVTQSAVVSGASSGSSSESSSGSGSGGKTVSINDFLKNHETDLEAIKQELKSRVEAVQEVSVSAESSHLIVNAHLNVDPAGLSAPRIAELVETISAELESWQPVANDLFARLKKETGNPNAVVEIRAWAGPIQVYRTVIR